MITVPNVTAFLAVLFLVATAWQAKNYLDAWYNHAISRPATQNKAMLLVVYFLAMLLFGLISVITGKPI